MLANQFHINYLMEKIDEDILSAPTNICEFEDENTTAIKECMNQLCGPADIQRSTFYNQDKIDQIVDSNLVEEHFQKDLPEITEQMKEHLAYARELTNEIKKRRNKLKLTQDESGDLIFRTYLPLLDISYNQEDGTLSISHDYADQFNASERKFFEGFSENLKKQAKLDWKIAFELGIPLQKSDLQNEIATLKQDIEKKLGSMPELSPYWKRLTQIELYLKYPNPGVKVTNKYLYTFAGELFKLNNLISKKLDLKTSRSLCDGLNCKKYFKNNMKRLINSKINRYEAGIRYYTKQGVANLARSCKSLYYLDQIEAQKAGNESELINTKFQQFLSFIKEKYSSESAQLVENYLRKGLTLTTENKTAQNESYVASMKKVGSEETLLKQKHITELINLSDYQITSELLNNFNANVPFFSQQLLLCEQWGGEHILGSNDHYNPMLNFLKISQNSCHHQVGIGSEVIFHELGHVLSDLIAKDSTSQSSKKYFLEQRSCVNSQYYYPEYFGAFRKWHPQDHHRSEEDMADYFAATLSNFIQNKDDGVEFINSCFWLPTIGGEYQVADLEGYTYDTHSAPAMRVIREAIYKGQALPPICEEVISRNDSLYQFKSCGLKD